MDSVLLIYNTPMKFKKKKKKQKAIMYDKI